MSADRVAVRVYSRLLWLLPGPLRREYAEPMRQTFADLCADTVRSRGAWAVVAILGATLGDLLGGAALEWVGALCDRRVWHRTLAGGLSVLAAVLVVYSQVRWPADLVRIDYVAQYLLIVNVLLALAGAFAAVRARTVLTGLATLPGWLVGLTDSQLAHRVGLGYVAVLVVVAAIRDRHRWAGLMAGVLTGILVFLVNLGDGLLGPIAPQYRAEFVHCGQSSLPAYAIGERINGGALLLLCCAVFGFLASVAVRCARVRWRYR